MTDIVKVGFAVCVTIAATAIVCVALQIYFSPYQSCTRETGNAAWCARAVGGHMPFN
jgi:hypothetical protein